MEFYNREAELNLLTKIRKKSLQAAQMTLVIGRRRIGKTSLLAHSVKDQKHLYFFVAKKNEALLCAEYTDLVKQVLGVEIFGEIKSFKDLFGYLMELSATTPFTLIIDEFQEFSGINPSVYSEIQNIWDNKKEKSKINLILCGSIYSLMKNIFENAKEPLFGRATARLHLKPFTIETLKTILKDHHPNYKQEDLLAFYLFTGGVAKYVELFTDAKAFTQKKILNEIFDENSLFLDEGKNVLIDEFGKDYSNYFSILTLIASSKTSRSEMESIMEMQLGGFLDKLENEFSIINKVRPIFAKEGSRNVKYYIEDNFLNFWFRFIYKYRSAIEIGNLNYVKNIVERDYTTYSGKILEKYFKDKLIQSGKYSQVGSYWKKNTEDEIDIIAVNELEKDLLFGEVKRNKEKINLNILREKSQDVANQFQKFHTSYDGFSLNDM